MLLNGEAGSHIVRILEKPTTLEASAAERFKKGVPSVREYCRHGTRAECLRVIESSAGAETCSKLHFRRVLESHTDPSLGDCAYLSTCRRTHTCKFVHYEIEEESASHGLPESSAFASPFPSPLVREASTEKLPVSGVQARRHP